MIHLESERDPLEEIVADYLDRCRGGELPSMHDYAERHPHLADAILELFPTIAQLERVKREDRKAAARSATLKPLQIKELGEFEIVREIGRGGMGIVYEAIQRSLERRVALKVLPKQALLDPVRLRRFQREARIAASLHHTNIVSLFGIGEHDGYHYLAMELIDGVSLQRIISHLRDCRALACDGENLGPGECVREVDGSCEQAASWLQRSDSCAFDNLQGSSAAHLAIIPTNGCGTANSSTPARGSPFPAPRKRKYWRNIARLGRDAARALQHAAERGVLHRDIKPGNLLIDVRGNIWISDFGLAQALSHQEACTTGSVVGTLSYIPPEGLSGQYNRQSDIYGLGVTLYELLTLEPVYKESSRAELIDRISDNSSQPTTPRKIDRSIPRDLEAIVLKAMAHEPGRRYQTAGDLASDLELFLQNRPVIARRISPVELLWRYCKRNRLSSALATIAVTLLATLFFAMTLGFLYADRARMEVQSALFREQMERKRAAATLEVATSALDDIYRKFAPSDLQEVSESFAVPHSEPVLSTETAAVLESLLEYYDRLANEMGVNPQVQNSAVNALCRIGDVHRQLGHHEQALDRYQLALRTLKKLRERDLDNTDLLVAMARLHNELGRVYTANREIQLARRSHQDALDLLNSVKIASDTHRLLYERARTLYFLGRRREISISQVARDQLDRRQRLPSSSEQPASIFRKNKQDVARSEYVHAALDVLSGISTEYWNDPGHRHLLACCFREIAQRRPAHSADVAGIDGEIAIDLLHELVECYPDNQHYRYDLIETLRSDIYAAPHVFHGREQTMRLLCRAKVHADHLVNTHPNVPRYAISRMHVFHKLGHVFTHMARDDVGQRATLLSEAESSLRLARDQAHRLATRWPTVLDHKLWLVVVDGSLAQVQLELGDKSEAQLLLSSAFDVLDSIPTNHMRPPMAAHASEVRRALVSLATRANDSMQTDGLRRHLD